MTTDPMRALKEGTAAEHAAIEADLPLLRPDLDRAAYARYLARLWGWYGPIEQRLAASDAYVAAVPDHAARRKVPWLARDLDALGVGVAARDALPRASALPAIGGARASRALGCAYVLEGSTLGSAVLVRALGARLDLRSAAAFLRGYGDATGPMWRAFGDRLRAAVRTPRDLDDAIAAARGTFASLRAWIAAPSVVVAIEASAP